jgi:hypothetical protein
MAGFRKGTTIEMPQYAVLQRELAKLTTDKKRIANKMKTALNFAMKPAYEALLDNVADVGVVTGNLRRAVQKKSKAYKDSGNAVAMAGYVKAGSDKKVKSERIKKLGRDKAYHAHLVEYGTRPRKTRKGWNRGYMPVGGKSGKPPMTTAYMRTVNQVNSRLVQKSSKVVDSLINDLKKALAQ